LPRDQAPVPGEQSARGHDPVEPQARGQQPGQAAITARPSQSGLGRGRTA
jgi:hypothetical protein